MKAFISEGIHHLYFSYCSEDIFYNFLIRAFVVDF